MPSGRPDDPDLLLPCEYGVAVLRQAVDRAVQVQPHQSPRRPTEVVHPRDRLLPAVAPLVQMYADPEPAELVRNRTLVGVQPEPRRSRLDPQRLVRPDTRGRTLQVGQ